MARLANCLQKATGKWADSNEEKHDILDHGMKRGIIAEVHRRLSSGQFDNVHEAEVAVVTEMRDKASADSAKVEAVLKAPRTTQAAAPRAGPTDRDTATQEAFARMRERPEEKFKLEQTIRSEFERIRAESQQMQAELPTPAPEDPEAKIEALDKEEDAAIEKLALQEKEQLDKATQSTQKRLIKTRFSGKRRVVEKDFTRQRQAVRARAREKTFQATREGKRMAADLSKVRAFAELNALVGALPPEVARAIGGTVTLAQLRSTDTSIERFLTSRIDRIDKELEKHFRGVYEERIAHLLKTFKPKKSAAGVLKSRIGADAQDVVERVTRYSKMTGEQVTARLQAIEHELAAGGLEPEAESILTIEQHELNTFGATNEMTAAELEAAHNDLAAMIKADKATWSASEEARLADIHAKQADVTTTLGIGTPPGIEEKNHAFIINRISNFARSHSSFVQILDKLFPKLGFIKEWQSTAIEKDGKTMDDVIATNDRLLKAIAAGIGSNSKVKAGSALKAMTTPSIQGPKGMMTKRHAIQYLFAWGQPAVRERMIKHGWTEAHVAAMVSATQDGASQALIKFMRQEYETIYQKANEVYKRMYGMSLPRIEGTYAPMRYHGAGGPADISPTGAFVSSGVTPSAIKARVGHSAELRQVDALDVFEEHLQQMTHWTHFAEFIRETRGVLNGSQARMSLEQHLGNKGLNDLNKQLDAVTRNGVTRASDVAGINEVINGLSSGVAISAMAFNLHSAAVQLDSGIRWMHAIPIHRWHRALLLHQWLPQIHKAWSSPTVQRRLVSGSDPAIQHAMGENKWTHPWLLWAVDKGFLPINAIDAAFTSVSSAIVFSDAKAQGLSDEEAMQKMDEAVARFSQPIMVTTKSQVLVNASPAMKSLFMFMADPMLKTSLAAEGIQAIRRGEWELGARRIMAVEAAALLSQLVVNMWSHVAGGGDGDDEEGWWYKNFWRAALLAPLQGFFVVGNIAEGLITYAMNYLFDQKEKVWPHQTAVARFGEDVVKTFSPKNLALAFDPSEEDFLKEWTNILNVAATTSTALTPAGKGVAAATAVAKQAIKATQAGMNKLEELK
jgi:hypothetical protein